MQKKGFSLIEILLVLGIGVAIVTAGVLSTQVLLRNAEKKQIANDIDLTLKNANSFISTNKPDGSSKTENPISISLLEQNNFLPPRFSEVKDLGFLVPEMGQIEVGYSNDYPKANVLEFKILGLTPKACEAIVENSHKFLEVNIAGKYLVSNKRTNADGTTYYTPNISKSLDLCKTPTNNVTRIRYYVQPDLTKIYTAGGDIAGTSDPNAPSRNNQIKAFTDANDYVYGLKNSHIRTN